MAIPYNSDKGAVEVRSHPVTDIEHFDNELGAAQSYLKCPTCGYGFMTKVNGKCKLRTRVLVFADNGAVMGICPKCKTNLKVPVSLSRCQKEGPV